MNPVRLIDRKRDGENLSANEIRDFVEGYASEKIPDYQMSAMAMAIYFSGMNADEIAALTQAMLDSGTRLAWPDDGIRRVDKHSTGGIGDKVSLVLAPLLACCGVQVPMLSGRGLGPTGGTLDKLEAIPGFRTDLSLQEIRTLTQSVGCVITGASRELAPVDRRLYALRDVTGTVPSIPLITASILSKKLAESPEALVLDVKFGNGAFMSSKAQAAELARSLVETGRRMGVTTTALLTDMNQPLGQMCGNAVEVREAMDALQGNGESDLIELTLALAEELIPGESNDRRARLQSALDQGDAFRRFEDMVSAQGGDLARLTTPAAQHDVLAERDGSVRAIDTRAIGYAIIDLGGGRRQLSDKIDHTVGVRVRVQVGDSVQRGQVLATIHATRPNSVRDAVRAAITIADDGSCSPLQLIHERITA